jgi:hypothetical protein
MNKKVRDYLIILFITLVVFLVYFLRSSHVPFLGIDSYYFLNHIFYGSDLFVTGFFGTFIINLLPANIFIIKLIMFFITLLTLFIAYKCAELYENKYALIYPLSLLAFISFSLVFFKFEDDIFSLPFLFGSLYFIIRYQLSSKLNKIFNKNIILSVLFLGISILIWKYTVLFILVYLFLTNFHYIYILLSSVFIIFYKSFLFTILPNNLIAENSMAFISGNIAGGIIILLFFLFLKKSMIRENRLAIYLFSVLTLLNYKLIYILTPILLLNNIKLLKNISLDKHKVIYFIWFLFLIGTVNQIIISPPSYSDYKLIGVTQSLETQLEKDTIYNWGYGYFAIWNKIDTNYFGSTPIDKISYKNHLVVIEKNNPLVSNCEKIEKGKWFELVNCS